MLLPPEVSLGGDQGDFAASTVIPTGAANTRSAAEYLYSQICEATTSVEKDVMLYLSAIWIFIIWIILLSFGVIWIDMGFVCI